MKILDLIQFGNISTAVCENCIHFNNDPTFIEHTYPGLTTMSSGFASVRDKDGICDYHQRYLSGRDSCTSFATRTAQLVVPNKQ